MAPVLVAALGELRHWSEPGLDGALALGSRRRRPLPAQRPRRRLRLPSAAQFVAEAASRAARARGRRREGRRAAAATLRTTRTPRAPTSCRRIGRRAGGARRLVAREGGYGPLAPPLGADAVAALDRRARVRSWGRPGEPHGGRRSTGHGEASCRGDVKRRTSSRKLTPPVSAAPVAAAPVLDEVHGGPPARAVRERCAQAEANGLQLGPRRPARRCYIPMSPGGRCRRGAQHSSWERQQRSAHDGSRVMELISGSQTLWAGRWRRGASREAQLAPAHAPQAPASAASQSRPGRFDGGDLRRSAEDSAPRRDVCRRARPRSRPQQEPRRACRPA